jgi:glycosyltransferase involved in cell wall biosynthesis
MRVNREQRFDDLKQKSVRTSFDSLSLDYSCFMSLLRRVSTANCRYDLVAPRIVAAMPALNEEKTIAKVIVHAKPHAQTVLVIDDGSSDDTGLIAEGLGAVVIKHSMNLGKGAALRDCFQWAKANGADVLITLDADGQHDPSNIPKLANELLTNHADLVIGSREFKPDGMSLHRWFGKRALDRATRVKVDGRLVDAQSGFRAYSRRAIENLVAAEYGMGVDSEIIMRARDAKMRIIEVPVGAAYANLKTSSHNPLFHALDVLFSIVKFVSIRHPLTFYGGFGLVSLVISLFFGFLTLDYYQHWGRVLTNSALISIAAGVLGFLSIFTGMILFTLITVVREQRR